jgi:hypothetical protein
MYRPNKWNVMVRQFVAQLIKGSVALAEGIGFGKLYAQSTPLKLSVLLTAKATASKKPSS